MRAALALLLLLSATLAEPAFAAPRNDRFTEAEQHYREGGRLLRTKKYNAAIVEFERALALGANPMALFSLAQAHTAIGNYEKALMFFRLFTGLSPRSPLRFVAKGQIAQVRARLARRGGVPPAGSGVAPEAPDRPDAVVAAAPPPAPKPIAAAPPPSPVEPAPAEAPPPLLAGLPSAPIAGTASPALPVGPPALAAATLPDAPRPERPKLELPVAASPPVAPLAPLPAAPDREETAGAALVIGGAALAGAGIGLAVWAARTSAQFSESLVVNEPLAAQTRVLSIAASVFNLAGLAATLGGAELLHRSNLRRIAGAAVAVGPLPGGAIASFAFRY